MEGYRLFWGDSHANIHSEYVPALDTCLTVAREMLDFLPMAYYPYHASPRKGFLVEDWLPAEPLGREWKAICNFAAANNRPGELVVFPGYEWQGTGVSGDHNICFLDDHPPSSAATPSASCTTNSAAAASRRWPSRITPPTARESGGRTGTFTTGI